MGKIILAADLSLTCPGFAVLDVSKTKIEVLHLSHVKTNSKKTTGNRLYQIHLHLTDILENHKIDEIVMEKGFNKFALATQQIQRTVGMFLLTCHYHYPDKPVLELSPTSVRKEVCGSGKADKDELAKALYKYVRIDDYKTNDESDAVGVGVAIAIVKKWVEPIK